MSSRNHSIRIAFHLALLVSAVAQQASAQKTLFDVPSLDIVEAKKLFFQEQASFTTDGVNTTTAFSYGMGSDIEVGVTVYQLVFQKAKGVEVDPTKPDENPDFLFSAQKGFEIREWVTLGLGTRSGVNAARAQRDIHFVNFDYVNSQFTIGNAQHKLLMGAYYANNAYVGSGNNVGFMGGVDLVLMPGKCHFIADFLSGNSSVGTINTGFEWELPKQWRITVGALFPYPGSDNQRGAIVQVSKN